MGDERRKSERVRISLPVKWFGMTGSQEARLQDISFTGCFVDTRARAELTAIVNLQILLPSDEWLTLKGEVTSVQPGIGFGLEFMYETEYERQAVKELCYFVSISDSVLD
jgi:PilZ domain